MIGRTGGKKKETRTLQAVRFVDNKVFGLNLDVESSELPIVWPQHHTHTRHSAFLPPDTFGGWFVPVFFLDFLVVLAALSPRPTGLPVLL